MTSTQKSTQKSHCADKCCKKSQTYLEQPAIQKPKDEIRDVKLAITENQEKLILKIDGMCCASEIDAVKQVLNPLIKGKDANLAFDLINGKLTIENKYGDLPSKDQIIKAIAKAGLTATLWQDHVQQAGNATFWQKHGAYIMNLISLVTLIVGVVIHGVKQGAAPAFGGGVGGEEVDRPQDPPVATIVVYCVSILTGGYLILPKAFSAVRRVRPDPNFLMTLASAGAIGLNHWFEAASSMYLFSLAGLIENWNMARARKAIRKLMELAPTTAQVMDEDGKVTEQLVENVPINSIIVIRPGEKVPMDSILIIGSTSVNQAPITGESMPVQKEIGDQLFAGTINGDGSIQCRVVKAASDSTLSNIIKKVEEAQSRRAKSDQWIEKFCLYYVPAVMMASVIVAIIPPLASKDRSLSSTWYPWIYKGLEILVISCPCSLVISTPVSIIAGLAAAARSGVLIKGGLYLELASKLNAFAMDKTGTLTNGEPVVQHIIPLNNLTEKEFLKLAIALEIHSDHPLARAIQRKAKADGIKYQPAEDFQVFKGKGGEGYIDGELFWIGSHRLVHEKVGDNEPTDVHEKIQELEAKGHSTVVIGQNQRIWGLISIADSVRKESKTAIQAMKQAGIKRIVMLTGDNKGAAKTIAESINIDEYRAELLPEDKVKQVEELVKTYKMVAMVGDGVNDAPAMATATIGVAMGAAGSDAAIETADIALMSDDLAKLAWLVKHARSTLNVIYQNVILSLAVKAVFAGLIFGDKSTLWMAILADVGTTFVVVSNALRLINNGSKQRKRERKLKEQEKEMTYRETFCPTEERMEFATPSHDIKVEMPSNTESIAKKGGCCKSKNCKQNLTQETGTTHSEIIRPIEEKMEFTNPSCESKVVRHSNTESIAKKGGCCKSKNCKQNSTQETGTTRQEILRPTEEKMEFASPSSDTKVVIPSSTESVGCCKSKSCKQNSTHETGSTHQEILSPTEKRMEVTTPSCDIKVVMPLNTELAAKKSGCCKSKNCKQNLVQESGIMEQDILRPNEEKMELATPSSGIKVAIPSNTESNAKKGGCCKSKNCNQNLTQETGATHQELLRPIEEKMEFTNPSSDIKVAMPSNSESVDKKGGCCKSKNCKQNLTQETATTQSEIIRPTEEKLQGS